MHIPRTPGRAPGDVGFANVKSLGAVLTEEGTRFSVWAPGAKDVRVRLFEEAQPPKAGPTYPLARNAEGAFEAVVASAQVDALYKFVVDGKELPDPYARDLPFGVHGPARVVARDAFRFRHPVPARTRPLVIYELHVGTFTQAGTYAAAAEHLHDLLELGVNAIELLPVSSFAGARGWGYDGVAHYAPFAGYGTPAELQTFVDRAHGLGLHVLLDVVYNHFGPAGNYLSAYDPGYFTDRHKTAWGDAPDFTSPAMRGYVLDNARMWLEEYRFDGLRLDATHGILDDSPVHILRELAELAASLDPPRVLIAEDERNEPALVHDHRLDAVWADDFHHTVRVSLTGETDGYYAAYRGGASELARVIDRGWLYEGQINPTTGKPRGRPAHTLAADNLVYCVQNHDQIGNRALGERLSADVSREAYRAASMLLLFLPMTPLLFMGQEWGSATPFLYFTDHDPELGALISKGRRDEFKAFSAFADPKVRSQIPDPQAEETFLRSKLSHHEKATGEHARTLAIYKAMLRLRRDDAVLRTSDRTTLTAHAVGDVLEIVRKHGDASRVFLWNLGDEPVEARQVAGAHAEVIAASHDSHARDAPVVLAPCAAVVLAR
ncbi:MAG: malto-oligosyltrehalose trehalohydrolase [Myxococcaceae bacterium]|nr:malto-oligosyltrehalose trehalohydrolase [Myxococcaceae bacterium]